MQCTLKQRGGCGGCGRCNALSWPPNKLVAGGGPELPARPVRPHAWMYDSGESGTLNIITIYAQGTSKAHFTSVSE